MRHIIDAIAAQGRGDDTELLHVTKGEMRGLESLARRHFGRELPRNPRTGLKEASLFQDWLGEDVGQVMDVAAPVAVAFIPGVGPVAATAMGAGIGAANQGLGKNGTTESALMGGVMGGIGAYGGSGLAEGLGAGASAAAPTGVTPGVTPIGEAGANLVTTGAEGSTAAAPNIAEAGDKLAQFSGQGQMQGQTAMQSMPNLAQNTPVPQGVNMPGASTPPPSGTDAGLKWDYLKSKDALSPAAGIVTSAIGTAGIPSAPQNTDSTVPGVNKTLPKSEVYYTPYGERRTRIVAAEGGLMSMNGAYGDYDGAEDDQGIRRYDMGGTIRSMQPGGAFGDWHGQLYGQIANATGIDPGGTLGQLTPGANQYHDKKRQEEENKANEEKAKAAAAAKAQQQQELQQQWADRYGIQSASASGIASMAEGGYTGPQGRDAIEAILKANQPKEENAFANPMIRKIAGQNVPQADFDAWNASRQPPNAFESPAIRHISGQKVSQADVDEWNNRQRSYAGGGVMSLNAAKGRYLQGPGDGMSDSIPANIDGKQEARLASGEFVVPADVVSGLGNGDSNAGAKQLHAMMDRTRQARTGTKKQGKQINPRKVMPT